MNLEQALTEVDRLTVIANKLSRLLDEKNNKIESLSQEVTTLWYEIDHLNGVLIIDRISSVQRALLKSKLKRLEKLV